MKSTSLVTLTLFMLTTVLAACGDSTTNDDPIADQSITNKKDMTSVEPDAGPEVDSQVVEGDAAVQEDVGVEVDMSEADATVGDAEVLPDTMDPDSSIVGCQGAPNGTPCGDSSETDCDSADSCMDGVCVTNYAGDGASCGEIMDDDCTNPDVCDGQGNCLPNNELDGVACGDTSTDECDGADTCLDGACADNYLAQDTTCGDELDNDCTDPDTCDGMGNCMNHDLAIDAPCGDTADTDCGDPDTCDGAGVCLTNDLAAGAACGDQSTGECNAADSCDENGICQPNAVEVGAPCGDQTATECNAADSCDASGVCQDNALGAGAPCGDSSNSQCTSPDSCDASGSCQPNHAMLHTPCGDLSTTECTAPDACNNFGNCMPNHVADDTACGDQNTVNPCNSPDSCLAGVCADNITPEGDACGDDTDSDCTDPNTCDASENCLENHESDGVMCLDCSGGAGQCDQCAVGVCENLGPCGIMAPGSITTTFASNNGYAGNIFDVVGVQPIVINSFDINVDSAGTNTGVAVYFKRGTGAGFDTDSSAWTLLATTTVTSQGTDVATPLNLDLGVSVSAGETVAFYLTSTTYGDGAGWNYTNGTTYGNLLAQDGNLQVTEGYGKGFPAFNTQTFNTRNWNGTIHYATGGGTGIPMSLETSYTTDTTTQGQMFDITAINDVDVTGFQLNLDAGDHDVEVYFRMGTHVGYEADGLAWAPLVAATITSAGAGAGTALVLPSAVQIPSGRSYGFYITTTGNTQLNAITPTAAVGDVAADDVNIDVLVGTGVTYSYGATSAPQVFSGAVDYNACNLRPTPN